MITLTFVFWMFVTLGAIIGALRGWAKELLVTFSVILAIFILTVLETFVGFVGEFFRQSGPVVEFWTRSLIVLLLGFFGYQTPNIRALAKGAARERLQDSLLGIVLGGLNGYLIIGSVWAFLHRAGYPFEGIIPPNADLIGASGMQLIALLPPFWLGVPGIYFAVAIAFTFIVIVFI